MALLIILSIPITFGLLLVAQELGAPPLAMCAYALGLGLILRAIAKRLLPKQKGTK